LGQSKTHILEDKLQIMIMLIIVNSDITTRQNTSQSCQFHFDAYNCIAALC